MTQSESQVSMAAKGSPLVPKINIQMVHESDISNDTSTKTSSRSAFTPKKMSKSLKMEEILSIDDDNPSTTRSSSSRGSSRRRTSLPPEPQIKIGMEQAQVLTKILADKTKHAKRSTLKERLHDSSTRSSFDSRASGISEQLRLSTEAQQARVRNVAAFGEVCAAIDPVVSWTQCFARSAIAGKLAHTVLSVLFISISVLSLHSLFKCVLQHSMDLTAGTVSRFVLITHYLQCIVAVYYIWRTTRQLPIFMNMWLTTYSEVTAEHTPLSKLILMGKVLMSYSVLLSIFLALFFAASCLELGDIVHFPDNCTCIVMPSRYELRWTNSVILGLCTLPNLYMQTLYATLCGVIYYEFQHFSERFASLTSESPADKEMEAFRHTHLKLIEMMDLLDGLVSYYTWCTYCLNVPAISALIYAQMLDANITGGQQLALSVWVILQLLQIIIITVPPSFATDAAYAPLNQVMEFSNRRPVAEDGVKRRGSLTPRSKGKEFLSIECYEQVCLFIQQLQGRTIGVTCAGFFVLTKQVLLTLFSVVVTYFTLVIQLQMQAASTCDCDCSKIGNDTGKTVLGTVT